MASMEGTAPPTSAVLRKGPSCIVLVTDPASLPPTTVCPSQSDSSPSPAADCKGQSREDIFCAALCSPPKIETQRLSKKLQKEPYVCITEPLHGGSGHPDSGTKAFHTSSHVIFTTAPLPKQGACGPDCNSESGTQGGDGSPGGSAGSKTSQTLLFSSLFKPAATSWRVCVHVERCMWIKGPVSREV